LADFEVAAQELVLGAFAAVKQPEFGSLGQAEGDAGNVARSRGDAGASSEKCNLQESNHLN
jgi:hypothetical protein